MGPRWNGVLIPGDNVDVLLLVVTPALRLALERGEGLPADVTCYNEMTARHLCSNTV